MTVEFVFEIVKFDICNFTIFYKNKCNQMETPKNFEKTFVFLRKKIMTKNIVEFT
tara:strand:+ start:89 stop:253 length:165 start_codon:yes stop_codon:yes gene_type:complete